MLKPAQLEGASAEAKTSKIMEKFYKKRKTSELDPEDANSSDGYGMNYQLYKHDGKDSNSEDPEDENDSPSGSEDSNNVVGNWHKKKDRPRAY